ncbi:hypothetical protein [Streptomyces sp. NRRL F-5123]|uniref:hypothetical protein n=1 Tax=Streptomyces sp. NRRL F-5123 TaxID=1463856 RepID=UPI0004E0CED8|nr:hypothetical protein [Streptomyces sp. NRRL F-5123]
MITMAAQGASTRLSDLVADRRAELRLSLVKLAERCIDPETGVQEWKVGRLHRLERREAMEAITVEQIRALAAGLQCAVREVQDAAGEQFFGVETVEVEDPHAERVRILARRASDLSSEDLERLITIAQSFSVRHDGK